MRDRREFKRSMRDLFFPLTLGLYLLSAIWGYIMLGANATGLLLAHIPPGPALRAAGVCLFIHMLVTSTIIAVVLVRAAHRALDIASLNDLATCARGSLVHLGLSAVLLLSAALLAIFIPVFDALTGLIGSLTLPILSYALPAFFWVSTRRARGTAFAWWHVALLVLLGVFLAMVVVVGTIGAVEEIVAHYGEGGGWC